MPEEIYIILIGITILFFILLLVKEIFPKKIKSKFCTICAAVSITWISLLILLKLGLYLNSTIISLLIGGTVVGIFYNVEGKVKENLKLFRLPFLLTLVFIGYLLINFDYYPIKEITFLLALWIFFILIFLYKNNKNISLVLNKIVDCCKKW